MENDESHQRSSRLRNGNGLLLDTLEATLRGDLSTGNLSNGELGNDNRSHSSRSDPGPVPATTPPGPLPCGGPVLLRGPDPRGGGSRGRSPGEYRPGTPLVLSLPSLRWCLRAPPDLRTDSLTPPSRFRDSQLFKLVSVMDLSLWSFVPNVFRPN